jgi:hypothetical protein
MQALQAQTISGRLLRRAFTLLPNLQQPMLLLLLLQGCCSPLAVQHCFVADSSRWHKPFPPAACILCHSIATPALLTTTTVLQPCTLLL